MSDRQLVLKRVRASTRHRVDHPGPHQPPELPGGWGTFAAALEGAGGRVHGPFDSGQLAGRLSAWLEQRADGGRVVAVEAAASRLGPGPWELAEVEADPHSFEGTAVAVLLGGVAVAENGAVAVEGRLAPQRALPFLCRHLVLLVSTDAVVPDLHTAFHRLPNDALAHHHLTWISGPSKTADIEQTLVYGAHGPLTLDVFGMEP